MFRHGQGLNQHQGTQYDTKKKKKKKEKKKTPQIKRKKYKEPQR
jgi:hypothetical protein